MTCLKKRETSWTTGLGTGTPLGVVGELVVADFSIPQSTAVIHILDGFSVGRSGGLSTKVRGDFLDISHNVNDRALLGASLEDISSGGSLYVRGPARR